MSDRVSNFIESATIPVANKTASVGALGSIAGSIAEINWLALAGFVAAVGGFIVTTFFQWRRDRREERESEARMRALIVGGVGEHGE